LQRKKRHAFIYIYTSIKGLKSNAILLSLRLRVLSSVKLNFGARMYNIEYGRFKHSGYKNQ
jgi:hypothetical protein